MMAAAPNSPPYPPGFFGLCQIEIFEKIKLYFASKMRLLLRFMISKKFCYVQTTFLSICKLPIFLMLPVYALNTIVHN